jgi:hypothetical protein
MSRKPWTKMTATELAAATKQFDRGPGPTAVSPTAAELAKHRRATRPAPKRGRGRPAFGDGAVRVLFTIDPRLLARLDTFARDHGMKRSQVIAASVESYMKSKTFTPLPFAAAG